MFYFFKCQKGSHYSERKCSHENQKTVMAQSNVPKELNLLYIQREGGSEVEREREKKRERGRERACRKEKGGSYNFSGL